MCISPSFDIIGKSDKTGDNLKCARYFCHTLYKLKKYLYEVIALYCNIYSYYILIYQLIKQRKKKRIKKIIKEKTKKREKCSKKEIKKTEKKKNR